MPARFDKAKLLTDRPIVKFDIDGNRVLVNDVIVDLGEHVADLEHWAILTDTYDDDDWTVRWRDWGTYAAGHNGSPFISAVSRTETQIRVGAGFKYDGASLPMLGLVWLIAGSKEKYELAGLLHDKLYRVQAPRRAADYVFWLISRSGEEHIGPIRGWLTWAALRLFGGKAYRANGKKLHG